MNKTIERSRIIHEDHERIYSQLVVDILPEFHAVYNLGYLGFKIPFGKIKLINLSDKDDFRGAKAIVQMKMIPSFGISMEIGAPIKIYCRNFGAGSCSVDIIADKTSYVNSKFLNSVLDLVYKDIPGVAFLYRNIIPNIYFDEKLVVGSDDIKNRSFTSDMLESGVYYLMDKLLDKIEEKNQKTT